MIYMKKFYSNTQQFKNFQKINPNKSALPKKGIVKPLDPLPQNMSLLYIVLEKIY